MKKLFLLFISLLSLQISWAQESTKIKVEDVWAQYRFYPKGVDEIRTMKDGKSYTLIAHDALGRAALIQYSYETGKALDTLVRESNLGGKTLSNYSFNETEDKILIENEVEPIYRHSNRGYFYVYDLKTHQILPISKEGKQQEATFSPDGQKVGFVRENNLYYLDLSSGKEVAITQDGKKNFIINGIADWVYEEEFSFARAFFWSSDSKTLAYYRLDETEVPQFSIPIYKDLYPSIYTYKYPKAGEKNSLVSIHLYSLASGKDIPVDLGPEKDQYIPRIQWTQDPNSLCVYRLNRHQNHLEYLLANAGNGSTRLLIELKDPKYIDISKNDDLTFLPGNKEFILSKDDDGFLHYYRYSMNGKLINPIITGNYDATKLYGVDSKKGQVYFQAAMDKPYNREIYSIGLNGKGLKKLTEESGWNEGDFSKDFSYFIHTYSNINQAPKISVSSSTQHSIRVLEDNHELEQTKSNFDFQPFTFLTVPANGNLLNAWMIKPKNFDPNKKYPVLMYVYGGPGIQTVQNQFDGFDNAWYQVLASKGYIVVSVDGRGTGARGRDFEKSTYLNLGKLEVMDQIESAKWLAKQSYIDPSRIGIWGWSFGGYVSSNCITKGNDVFKMAIAIAPVTNWRYYDSIYTERYMTTPQENPTGYDENSPVNFADRLKGNFLIVHGTADDNVHLQNSIMFSEALIQLNKKFTQAYYPNRNHGIYGGNTRNHLYHRMTDFIVENL